MDGGSVVEPVIFQGECLRRLVYEICGKQDEIEIKCQLATTPLWCPALCEFLQLQADSFGTPISDAG